jgi:D-psicose/D-tagatose/L-ribulose 3-epimerase
MMTSKFAFSNIAWEPSEDDAVAGILRAAAFTGVEIAPTKRWESPIEATKREIAEYRSQWKQRGLSIVAMQSLLFGRPDLQLFGSQVVRRALREYLTALIEMAHGLGAQALVFGSPKNRQRGKMPTAEANEIASEFFREIGAMAMSRGCVVCIEPNPPSYDCDWINTTAEAVALCQSINSRGVKVQGDVGAIISGGADPLAELENTDGWLGHFHVSEPSLAEITAGAAQSKAAQALADLEYDRWISIEMRPAESGLRVAAVEQAVRTVKSIYASSGS